MYTLRLCTWGQRKQEFLRFNENHCFIILLLNKEIFTGESVGIEPTWKNAFSCSLYPSFSSECDRPSFPFYPLYFSSSFKISSPLCRCLIMSIKMIHKQKWKTVILMRPSVLSAASYQREIACLFFNYHFPKTCRWVLFSFDFS